MRKRSLVPSEHQEQCALIRWARLQPHPDYQLLFAIPNGGLRNKIVAANLKKEGVTPGIPDLFWPVPRPGFHGMFIEMKAKRGKLTIFQKEAHFQLLIKGYHVIVSRGWDVAREEMLAYHGVNPTKTKLELPPSLLLRRP